MKQFSNTIFNLGYFLILTMTAISLLFLSGQILLSHTYIPLRTVEGSQFISNPWYFYPILLFFLLSFFNPTPVGKGSYQVFFLDFVPHLTNAMTTGFYLVLKLPSKNALTFNLSKTRSFFPNHVYQKLSFHLGQRYSHSPLSPKTFYCHNITPLAFQSEQEGLF